MEPSPALESIGDEDENWSLADGSAPGGSNCVFHISVQITVLSSLPAFLRLMKHLIALTKNDQLIRIKRGKINKKETKHSPSPHLQHTSGRWGLQVLLILGSRSQLETGEKILSSDSALHLPTSTTLDKS